MTKIKFIRIEEAYPEDADDGNFGLALSLSGSMAELLAVQNAVLSMAGHGAVVIDNTKVVNNYCNQDQVIGAFHNALDKADSKRTVTIGLVTPDGTEPTVVDPYIAFPPQPGGGMAVQPPVIKTSPIPHIAQDSKVEYDSAKATGVTNVVSEPDVEAEQPVWAVDAFEAMTLAEVIKQALKGHNSSKEDAISWCLDHADRIAILSVVPEDKRRARLARAAEVVL